jgi:DNA repair ATPase RecN
MAEIIDIIVTLLIIYFFLSPLFKKKKLPQREESSETIQYNKTQSTSDSTEDILKELEILFGKAEDRQQASSSYSTTKGTETKQKPKIETYDEKLSYDEKSIGKSYDKMSSYDKKIKKYDKFYDNLLSYDERLKRERIDKELKELERFNKETERIQDNSSVLLKENEKVFSKLSEKNEFLESLVIKFSDKRNIKEFIIAKEILDKPLALRKYGKRIYA